MGRIFDMDPIAVVAAVSEREVGRLTVGDAGQARLITGGTVDGTVRFIGRVAEPETRTFRIELEVPNPDHAIPAGMTAHVLLPLETVPSHFISPSALSLADDGTLGVKVVDADNTVRRMGVTIVAASADGLWVAGLAPRGHADHRGPRLCRGGRNGRAGGGRGLQFLESVVIGIIDAAFLAAARDPSHPSCSS